MKSYQKAVSNVLWLFFPGLVLLSVLIAIGKSNTLIGNPEIALVSAVALGQSISSFKNVEKSDVWAYQLFSVLFFAGSLVFATLLAVNKYGDSPILIKEFPLMLMNFSFLISSVFLFYKSQVFEEKYNKIKNENASKAGKDAE